MINKTVLAVALVLTLAGFAAPALAQEKEAKVTDFAFSFEGPFGTYDQAQLQRGFQIFTEVCAACHGLQYVPFRALTEKGGLGYSKDEIRAYAKNYTVFDTELREERDGKFTDNFPRGSLPNAPDLSLMAKARAGFHGPFGSGINQLFKGMGGAEYIASLLLSYTGEEKEEAGSIIYENPIFYSGFMAMSQPLFGDDVEYEDGTEATLEQEALDVAAFLMWAAEPKLSQRKSAGLKSLLFLGVLAALLYFTNKRIWAPVKGRDENQV